MLGWGVWEKMAIFAGIGHLQVFRGDGGGGGGGRASLSKLTIFEGVYRGYLFLTALFLQCICSIAFK